MNILKEGVYKGFAFVVIGQSLGHRCGYIQITKKHKLYAKHYEELYQYNIHGGLTFDGNLYNDHRFYLGFDCAHLGDAKDLSLMSQQRIYYLKMSSNLRSSGTIRDTSYVIKECKQFIDQIVTFNINKRLHRQYGLNKGIPQ